MLPGITGIAGAGKADISYVDIATAAASSVTLPTHQAGDLILIMASANSGTIPSLPAGYTSIRSGTSNVDNDWSWNVGYKFAGSAADTSGTWTNAQLIAAAIYRNVAAIGANAETIDGTTTPTWGNLTLSGGSGSWVVGLLAHEVAVTATSIPFTTRDAVNYRTWWDTNGPVFTFTSVNCSLANGGRGTTTITVELMN